MDSVRILVLGSPRSGKTSLVHSLLHGEAVSTTDLRKNDEQHDLPAQLPAVSVPGLYGGTLYVVDGSSELPTCV